MSNHQTGALSYQDLGPHDILDSLESIGYLCDGRFLALNSYENRVYQVWQEDGPALIVKFYRPGRWGDEAIGEEHQFTTALDAQEIPVVAPLVSDAGSLHHHGAFRFAVYPCRGGRAPELDDHALLEQLGRFLGRIHLLGETGEFQHRPRVDVIEDAEESFDFLLREEFVPSDLVPAYESLLDDLIEQLEYCYERAGSARVIRIHGDSHPSNILVANDTLHIVDFDDACMGPAVQDLWMFLSGERGEQTPQLDSLLSGYTEFRDFDARELHLIEALRTFRVIRYCAWLARRWEDPAFKRAFPWFNSQRYWGEHVLALREQLALMQEPPLTWMG